MKNARQSKESSIVSIGDLRHRVTFQTLSRVSDNQGGFTESWSNLAEVWAFIKPVSSKERLFGQRLQYQRSHEVIIRFRNDITQEMRFLFDNRIFQIKGTRASDERKFFLTIDAEENQGT